MPSVLYRAKDGLIFFLFQTQRSWELLCERIGRAELIEDPDYRDQAARYAHRDQLTEVLDATLSARSTAQWLEVLGGAVPCAPVYDLQEALDNPFVAERQGVQLLDHPDRPGFKLVASSSWLCWPSFGAGRAGTSAPIRIGLATSLKPG